VQKDPIRAAPLVRELTRQTRALLDDIDYWGEKSPDRMCAELQAITGRAVLTTREASLLLGMVRKLAKDRLSS
jgi:tRNA C32,U32 (ribose-2'-O)-methylase TrmJ